MAKSAQSYDVAIIGAGAAGLFCASLIASKNNRTILIDHRQKVAEKIRISGGGRCNFTNLYSGPEHFLSQNKHFAKSALAGFSPQDFISMVEHHGIAYHEKKLGQLFCDHSAQDIIDMLLSRCQSAGVTNAFGICVSSVKKQDDEFVITTDKMLIKAKKLVIATGGLSIPKIGATGFGYDIASQFGLSVISRRAGLVPLTFTDHLKEACSHLSGLSVEACVHYAKTRFSEGLLFTHRGLSGPSILQISSYWHDGQPIGVNLVPSVDMQDYLAEAKKHHPKQDVLSQLAHHLPKRLASQICDDLSLSKKMADTSDKALRQLASRINDWQIRPAGTEGYRTAEVTLGGVDTADLSSKDMQAKSVPGLYFIGEVVDVTGHLGGHNFQWAWASAYAMASHCN
ncbi:MAG: NAD(P)/FAD-dependent oxidoreductase [Candidatus Puniceispirillaceae bacterium]